MISILRIRVMGSLICEVVPALAEEAFNNDYPAPILFLSIYALTFRHFDLSFPIFKQLTAISKIVYEKTILSQSERFAK